MNFYLKIRFFSCICKNLNLHKNPQFRYKAKMSTVGPRWTFFVMVENRVFILHLNEAKNVLIPSAFIIFY